MRTTLLNSIAGLSVRESLLSVEDLSLSKHRVALPAHCSCASGGGSALVGRASDDAGFSGVECWSV